MADSTAPADSGKAPNLESTLDDFRSREREAHKLSGQRLPDRNAPGHYLVVVNGWLFYSIDAKDIVDAQSNADDIGVFWIRNGAEVWKTKISVLGTAEAAAQEPEDLEAFAGGGLTFDELVSKVISGIKSNSGEDVAADDKIQALAVPSPLALTKLANILLANIADDIGVKVKNWLATRDMVPVWTKGTVKQLVAKIAHPLGVVVPPGVEK